MNIWGVENSCFDFY